MNGTFKNLHFVAAFRLLAIKFFQLVFKHLILLVPIGEVVEYSLDFLLALIFRSTSFEIKSLFADHKTVFTFCFLDSLQLADERTNIISLFNSKDSIANRHNLRINHVLVVRKAMPRNSVSPGFSKFDNLRELLLHNVKDASRLFALAVIEYLAVLDHSNIFACIHYLATTHKCNGVESCKSIL